MATYSNSRIQLRIDTEANWQSNNPTIASGELCLSSDKSDFKIGAGGLWNAASYWIANNPTVTSIRTAANNAQSTASNALNKANQAITIANAAAQYTGRVVDYKLFKNHNENKDRFYLDAEFIKNYSNNDIICYDDTVGGSEKCSGIDIAATDPWNEGNEIRFYFGTRDYFTVTGDFQVDAAGQGKILVIGNRSVLSSNNTITFDPHVVVEMCLINGCILKYNYVRVQ
jgi:hypothetical protein